MLSKTWAPIEWVYDCTKYFYSILAHFGQLVCMCVCPMLQWWTSSSPAGGNALCPLSIILSWPLLVLDDAQTVHIEELTGGRMGRGEKELFFLSFLLCPDRGHSWWWQEEVWTRKRMNTSQARSEKTRIAMASCKLQLLLVVDLYHTRLIQLQEDTGAKLDLLLCVSWSHRGSSMKSACELF